MKRIKTLLAIALAATAFAATTDVQAQAKHGWSGHRGGHGHWGGHWYGPRVGFYFGAPLLFGSYYWGAPYWDRYYYGPPVVYREIVREPEVVETVREEPATTELPRGEGAPPQGPLYMNYCASAKAYFPKVTQCPEGWKFISPNQ